MAATGEQAQAVIPQCKLDRICENFDLVKLAEEIVSWEDYVPYCGLSPAAEWEIKENSRAYGVQKRRMLERWKKKSGNDATYRNLAGIFERAGDQMLADSVYKLAQDQEQADTPNQNYEDQGETEVHHCSFSRILVICLVALIVLAATICYSQSLFLHQPAKDFGKNFITQYRPTQNYTQYVDKVKNRYKKHLPDVAQSFWLPTNMHTFIQLSLTSQDKPRVPKVDQYSANP